MPESHRVNPSVRNFIQSEHQRRPKTDLSSLLLLRPYLLIHF
jgi:hypothetical protein